MYLIYRFPGLKKTLEDLMSPAFGRYIKHVDVIAPKPTTFNISLINNESFTVTYIGRGNFRAKIAGRKYDPTNIGEQERASVAITDLLSLNYAPAEGKEEDCINIIEQSMAKGWKGLFKIKNESNEARINKNQQLSYAERQAELRNSY